MANDTDEAAHRKVPRGQRAEPLPDDTRSAVQISVQGKTVTTIVINQRMKEIFLLAKKNPKWNRERFEGYFFP